MNIGGSEAFVLAVLVGVPVLAVWWFVTGRRTRRLPDDEIEKAEAERKSNLGCFAFVIVLFALVFAGYRCGAEDGPGGGTGQQADDELTGLIADTLAGQACAGLSETLDAPPADQLDRLADAAESARQAASVDPAYETLATDFALLAQNESSAETLAAARRLGAFCSRVLPSASS